MLSVSFLISLLIALFVIAIILYVVNMIIGMLALPPQAKTIAYLIVGLIFLVWLLNTLGLYHFAL